MLSVLEDAGGHSALARSEGQLWMILGDLRHDATKSQRQGLTTPQSAVVTYDVIQPWVSRGPELLWTVPLKLVG